MKNISLDLIRVTEAAAIAASKWIGSGNKELADKAATDAMRARLNNIDFAGTIVIGEGEKDCSYGLFQDECVGNKNGPPCYEIAVDPIEGTTPTVNSGPEAISTIAVGHEGSMYASNKFYMRKMAYGPKIKKYGNLYIDDPIEETIEKIAHVTGKSTSEITVCILNRPRHEKIIQRLRSYGVRIKLISDCDVSGSVATCLPDTGVDLLYGIGGAPEAVLSAAAIKCLGGDIQAQEYDGDKSTNKWEPCGPVLGLEDLVQGECVFIATGITNGSILRGVRYNPRPVTNSVFMRSKSKTVRWLEVHHGN